MTDRTFEVPGGITAHVLRSTRETDGALFQVEIELAPRAKGPPPHVHVGQEESFTVTEGVLSVRSGREWLRLAAGETATVPSGTVHAFRNRSAGPTRMVTEMTPALVFEHMLRIQSESRVPPLLRIAAINHGPDASFFLAGLPIALQRPMWNVLAAIAKLARRDF